MLHKDPDRQSRRTAKYAKMLLDRFIKEQPKNWAAMGYDKVFGSSSTVVAAAQIATQHGAVIPNLEELLHNPGSTKQRTSSSAAAAPGSGGGNSPPGGTPSSSHHLHHHHHHQQQHIKSDNPLLVPHTPAPPPMATKSLLRGSGRRSSGHKHRKHVAIVQVQAPEDDAENQNHKNIIARQFFAKENVLRAAMLTQDEEVLSTLVCSALHLNPVSEDAQSVTESNVKKSSGGDDDNNNDDNQNTRGGGGGGGNATSTSSGAGGGDNNHHNNNNNNNTTSTTPPSQHLHQNHSRHLMMADRINMDVQNVFHHVTEMVTPPRSPVGGGYGGIHNYHGMIGAASAAAGGGGQSYNSPEQRSMLSTEEAAAQATADKIMLGQTVGISTLDPASLNAVDGGSLSGSPMAMASIRPQPPTRGNTPTQQEDVAQGYQTLTSPRTTTQQHQLQQQQGLLSPTNQHQQHGTGVGAGVNLFADRHHHHHHHHHHHLGSDDAGSRTGASDHVTSDECISTIESVFPNLRVSTVIQQALVCDDMVEDLYYSAVGESMGDYQPDLRRGTLTMREADDLLFTSAEAALDLFLFLGAYDPKAVMPPTALPEHIDGFESKLKLRQRLGLLNERFDKLQRRVVDMLAAQEVTDADVETNAYAEHQLRLKKKKNRLAPHPVDDGGDGSGGAGGAGGGGGAGHHGSHGDGGDADGDGNNNRRRRGEDEGPLPFAVQTTTAMNCLELQAFCLPIIRLCEFEIIPWTLMDIYISVVFPTIADLGFISMYSRTPPLIDFDMFVTLLSVHRLVLHRRESQVIALRRAPFGPTPHTPWMPLVQRRVIKNTLHIAQSSKKSGGGMGSSQSRGRSSSAMMSSSFSASLSGQSAVFGASAGVTNPHLLHAGAASAAHASFRLQRSGSVHSAHSEKSTESHLTTGAHTATDQQSSSHPTTQQTQHHTLSKRGEGESSNTPSQHDSQGMPTPSVQNHYISLPLDGDAEVEQSYAEFLDTDDFDQELRSVALAERVEDLQFKARPLPPPPHLVGIGPKWEEDGPQSWISKFQDKMKQVPSRHNVPYDERPLSYQRLPLYDEYDEPVYEGPPQISDQYAARLEAAGPMPFAVRKLDVDMQTHTARFDNLRPTSAKEWKNRDPVTGKSLVEPKGIHRSKPVHDLRSGMYWFCAPKNQNASDNAMNDGGDGDDDADNKSEAGAGGIFSDRVVGSAGSNNGSRASSRNGRSTTPTRSHKPFCSMARAHVPCHPPPMSAPPTLYETMDRPGSANKLHVPRAFAAAAAACAGQFPNQLGGAGGGNSGKQSSSPATSSRRQSPLPFQVPSRPTSARTVGGQSSTTLARAAVGRDVPASCAAPASYVGFNKVVRPNTASVFSRTGGVQSYLPAADQQHDQPHRVVAEYLNHTRDPIQVRRGNSPPAVVQQQQQQQQPSRGAASSPTPERPASAASMQKQYHHHHRQLPSSSASHHEQHHPPTSIELEDAKQKRIDATRALREEYGSETRIPLMTTDQSNSFHRLLNEAKKEAESRVAQQRVMDDAAREAAVQGDKKQSDADPDAFHNEVMGWYKRGFGRSYMQSPKRSRSPPR